MPHRALFLIGGLLVALPLLAGLTWLGGELLRPIPPTPTIAPSPAPTAVGGRNGLIAFTSTRDGNPEIYVMNADGSDQRNLTQHPAWDSDPAWSPDGQRLAFISDRAAGIQVFVLELETRLVTQVTDSPGLVGYPLQWSPDGQSLILVRQRGASPGGIRTGRYRVKVDGFGSDWLFPDDAVRSDSLPLWSAGGRYVAFQHSGSETAGLQVLETATYPVNVVELRDGAPFAWAPDSRQRLYHAQRALKLFDPESGQTRPLHELSRVESVAALPTQGTFTQTASLNPLYALNIENAFHDPASLQPVQLTFTGQDYYPRWQP